MSRWIDADALAKKLTDWSTGTVEPIDWSDIAVAPSIDIVRCGECKYYDDEDYGEPTRYCTWHESVVEADGFCSYGERSSE